MLKFLKHHFTKREKKLIKFRSLQMVIGIALGILFAGLVAVWQIHKDETRRVELKQEAKQIGPEQTVPPNGKSIGGPFTLTNQDGKTVTDTEFRGKYLLVYFGYTYCPDVCPTGLQSIAHALDQLNADAGKVQPLYITIDPARDTPQKLKDYITSFHPSIIGLTGTPEQIAAVAKEYQVYYARGEQVDEHDYMMDHSSQIYLMDLNGKFITTFEEEVDPALLVKTLREQWSKAAPVNLPVH